MSAGKAASLRAQINHLSAELATCKTPAEIRCLKQAIAAAERQLTEG